MNREAPLNWNQVPAEIQKRVVDHGVDGVAELAAWAYEHRALSARNDDVNDVLRALMVFLMRAAGEGTRRRLESLPAILTTIAYRQRCQRYRDEAAQNRAQLSRPSVADARTAISHVVLVDLRASLRKALRRLTAREREAVIRKHLLEESCREIAKAIFGPGAGKKEEGHVSVILARARLKMRTILREEDV